MTHESILSAQASAWEHIAVLTEAQERACDAVSEQCTIRPMPAHVGPSLTLQQILMLVWHMAHISKLCCTRSAAILW